MLSFSAGSNDKFDCPYLAPQGWLPARLQPLHEQLQAVLDGEIHHRVQGGAHHHQPDERDLHIVPLQTS